LFLSSYSHAAELSRDPLFHDAPRGEREEARRRRGWRREEERRREGRDVSD